MNEINPSAWLKAVQVLKAVRETVGGANRVLIYDDPDLVLRYDAPMRSVSARIVFSGAQLGSGDDCTAVPLDKLVAVPKAVAGVSIGFDDGRVKVRYKTEKSRRAIMFSSMAQDKPEDQDSPRTHGLVFDNIEQVTNAVRALAAGAHGVTANMHIYEDRIIVTDGIRMVLVPVRSGVTTTEAPVVVPVANMTKILQCLGRLGITATDMSVRPDGFASFKADIEDGCSAEISIRERRPNIDPGRAAEQVFSSAREWFSAPEGVLLDIISGIEYVCSVKPEAHMTLETRIDKGLRMTAYASDGTATSAVIDGAIIARSAAFRVTPALMKKLLAPYKKLADRRWSFALIDEPGLSILTACPSPGKERLACCGIVQ